jgi:hypothetical protein
MEVEGHEEALMDVVVFCKARPTAPEVLLAITIIPHFYLIWDASARLLAKDSLSQLAAIHKFGKVHRQTLNLMTLPQGNAEKRENARRSSGKRKEQKKEEQQDLVQCQPPWACSYYQVDGRGDASLEHPTKYRWQREWPCSYFCYHEGDLDLVAPPEIQGSAENLQHLP